MSRSTSRPAQLRNPNFEILVQRILAETGLQPSRLELEVTETYLISNPIQAGQSINAIRSARRIDRARRFRHRLFEHRLSAELRLRQDEARPLAASSASPPTSGPSASSRRRSRWPNSLGLGIVAEGVESEDEAMLLRLAGCREFQGYHFAAALSGGRAVAPARRPVRTRRRALDNHRLTKSGFWAAPAARAATRPAMRSGVELRRLAELFGAVRALLLDFLFRDQAFKGLGLKEGTELDLAA